MIFNLERKQLVLKHVLKTRVVEYLLDCLQNHSNFT